MAALSETIRPCPLRKRGYPSGCRSKACHFPPSWHSLFARPVGIRTRVPAFPVGAGHVSRRPLQLSEDRKLRLAEEPEKERVRRANRQRALFMRSTPRPFSSSLSLDSVSVPFPLPLFLCQTFPASSCASCSYYAVYYGAAAEGLPTFLLFLPVSLDHAWMRCRQYLLGRAYSEKFWQRPCP